MEHFLQTYVYAESLDADIARHILGLLWAMNFGQETTGALSDDRVSIVSAMSLDGMNVAQTIYELLETYSASERAVMYYELNKVKFTSFDLHENGNKKTAITSLVPSEFLTYWAAVTLTMFEGRDEDLPDTIREAYKKSREVLDFDDSYRTIDKNYFEVDKEKFIELNEAMPKDIGAAIDEVYEILADFGTLVKPCNVVGELNRRLGSEMQAAIDTHYGKGPQ